MLTRVVAIALITTLPGTAVSGELVTPSFRIIVTENCQEGDVSCQDVSYIGTSRRTGKSITLKGLALSSMCSDGVTPCQHLGYQFKNGRYVYFVGDDGHLLVTRNGTTIISEMGKWTL